MNDSLTIDESAVKRIEVLRGEQSKNNLRLRITVDSGGCSGFQYILALSDEQKDDDVIIQDVIVTDSVSLPFLKGSTVSFKTGLAGSEFQIDNPNAVSGCGCGTSFSIM